jgi:hypothetical protein
MATATYKGRKYRLEWSGDTKFGRKAKLSFWDGSKTFWVDLSAVTIEQGDSAPDRGNGRNVCAECGKGGALVSDLEDGLMKHYRCCDIPPGGY